MSVHRCLVKVFYKTPHCIYPHYQICHACSYSCTKNALNHLIIFYKYIRKYHYNFIHSSFIYSTSICWVLRKHCAKCWNNQKLVETSRDLLLNEGYITFKIIQDSKNSNKYNQSLCSYNNREYLLSYLWSVYFISRASGSLLILRQSMQK